MVRGQVTDPTERDVANRGPRAVGGWWLAGCRLHRRFLGADPQARRPQVAGRADELAGFADFLGRSSVRRRPLQHQAARGRGGALQPARVVVNTYRRELM